MTVRDGKGRIERSHKERTRQLHVPNPRLIQGLPMPRKDTEADGLTAETMRENFRLRQENELLRKECRLLAAKADGRKRPNTEMVKALLAEAERSIATGSKIVERQRCIIKELERDGHDTSQARSVLHELLNTQSLHVLTRDRLLGLLTE
jgi:hypothetical protein